MSEVIEAYPLTWPAGRPRARARTHALFKTPLGAAIAHVQREVHLLGGSSLVISSNQPLRRDGLPSARAGYISDVGVAVYFNLKKKPMCFACDRWDAVEDNVHAIGKTIEALRGIERWGSGSMVEQAFTGFLALPAPPQWFQVLEVSSVASREEIIAAHRRIIAKHPEFRTGGAAQDLARINVARDDGLAQIGENTP